MVAEWAREPPNWADNGIYWVLLVLAKLFGLTFGVGLGGCGRETHDMMTRRFGERTIPIIGREEARKWSG
jgi:hypothetical protein